MVDYRPLYNTLAQDPRLSLWAQQLPALVADKLALDQHGKMAEWQNGLAQLPTIPHAQIELDKMVSVPPQTPLEADEQAALEQTLMTFHPWRKGPFWVHGLHIDTEWRSDWKWERLKAHIQPLSKRLVLDVGSGNGYYGWRMLGAGARLVLGLDPFLVYVLQYQAMHHFLGGENYVLPLGYEALPTASHAFDTVFSMGVLYHCRSPFDHLYILRDSLRQGGELVLETLVVEGGLGEVLVPEGRYAQMRNVWFLPSVPTLVSWLKKCKFRDVRVIDVTSTTTAEQRTTDWMRFHSLTNFLDSTDVTKTVEGHPAPRRAIILATAP